MPENEFGDISHDWFRLNEQVAQYLIAVSASNQLDCVSVDAGTEERHGTCAAEGLNRDILGFKAQVLAAELDGGIEGLGDHCGSYVFPPSRWRHDAGYGGGGWCVVHSQVEGAPNQGGVWTQKWFPRGL